MRKPTWRVTHLRGTTFVEEVSLSESVDCAPEVLPDLTLDSSGSVGSWLMTI